MVVFSKISSIFASNSCLGIERQFIQFKIPNVATTVMMLPANVPTIPATTLIQCAVVSPAKIPVIRIPIAATALKMAKRIPQGLGESLPTPPSVPYEYATRVFSLA